MAEEAVEQSRYRRLPVVLDVAALLLTGSALVIAVLNIFHIIAFGIVMVESTYFFLVIGTLLPLTFFYYPATQGSRSKIPWYDVVFAFASFGICFYFSLHWEQILFSGWEVTPPPFPRALAFAIVFLVLEAVRRTTGLFIAIFILCFCVYPLFAIHMPGLLMAKSFSLTRVAGYLAMGPEGLIGLPIRVFSQIFIGFMLFSVVLQHTGGGAFLINVALSLLGMVRGGVAKVAVLASSLMGSISGSAMANVITTGSVTIPAMKRTGYPPYYAGAVEACASTGGVITPPIMGAAAFVMANFLDIPYSRVALGAAIPAILYYIPLFIQADAFAATHGLRGLPRSECPGLSPVLKEGWFYVFALVVLVYALFFLHLEAQSPFFASVAMMILAMMKKKTRLDAKKTVAFLRNMGQVLSELVAILAGIGLLIGSLYLTGVAQTLSSELIRLAHGNMWALVVLGAITSFILGMGMTITACYVILAILVAPTLVQLGMDAFAIHFFLLYCGNLSNITPPVALAAYAASPIAQASPMRIGYQAMRLGIGLFILPFLFVARPALLLIGTPAEIFLTTASCAVGTLLVASVAEGYLIGAGKLNLGARIFLAAASVFFFYSSWITSLIGIGIAGPFMLLSKGLRDRKSSI